MRLLLDTDIHISRKDEIVSALKCFDDSFGKRYLSDDGTLQGESHADQQRQHLFFLEIDDRYANRFVEHFSRYDWCHVIAPADADYNVTERPLFVSNNFNKIARERRTLSNLLLDSIKTRAPGFTPRQPAP